MVILETRGLSGSL